MATALSLHISLGIIDIFTALGISLWILLFCFSVFCGFYHIHRYILFWRLFLATKCLEFFFPLGLLQIDGFNSIMAQKHILYFFRCFSGYLALLWSRIWAIWMNLLMCFRRIISCAGTGQDTANANQTMLTCGIVWDHWSLLISYLQLLWIVGREIVESPTVMRNFFFVTFTCVFVC